jgi:hypothetical protein
LKVSVGFSTLQRGSAQCENLVVGPSTGGSELKFYHLQQNWDDKLPIFFGGLKIFD